jgi:predicted HD phosphohydrolase
MGEVGGSTTRSIAASVDDIVRALLAGDRVRTSEGPTVLHHGLACAETLRRAFPDDPELQVAGLVHDLGHVLDPADQVDHARNAAYFVGIVLGARVAEMVAEHVVAGRYLVTVDAVRVGISGGGAVSLWRQTLDPDEVDRFRANRWWRDTLVMRRADDLSRGDTGRVRPLVEWLPTLEHVAREVGYLL